MGTKERLITLRAETPGNVFIEGNSYLHLGGEYLMVNEEFQLTIGNETGKIKKGDSFYIPPHVMHEPICLKTCVLKMYLALFERTWWNELLKCKKTFL